MCINSCRAFSLVYKSGYLMFVGEIALRAQLNLRLEKFRLYSWPSIAFKISYFA